METREIDTDEDDGMTYEPVDLLICDCCGNFADEPCDCVLETISDGWIGDSGVFCHRHGRYV